MEPNPFGCLHERRAFCKEPRRLAQEGPNISSGTFGLIGSPATIREKLRKFQETNVDQVILLNQAGKNTHEDICSSLELFAAEVMPEFHANEDEHQAWKRGVLAGDIVLDELDTAPFQMARER
jgi:hypothetical protein